MIAWKKRNELSQFEEDMQPDRNDRLYLELMNDKQKCAYSQLVKECRRITFLIMSVKVVVGCGFAAVIWYVFKGLK